MNRHMAPQSWRRAGASCRADSPGKVRIAAHCSFLGISLLCQESSCRVPPTDGRKRVQLGNLAGHSHVCSGVALLAGRVEKS